MPLKIRMLLFLVKHRWGVKVLLFIASHTRFGKFVTKDGLEYKGIKISWKY